MKTKMQILQLSNQKVKIKEGKKKWLNRKMLKCLSWRTKKIREIYNLIDDDETLNNIIIKIDFDTCKDGDIETNQM